MNNLQNRGYDIWLKINLAKKQVDWKAEIEEAHKHKASKLEEAIWKKDTKN